MRIWKRFAVISLVLVALLFVVAVVAALALEPAAPDQTALTWQVAASGGATMSGPSYTMLSTAGQPATGTSGGASYSLLSGYWVSFQQAIRLLFLPYVSGSPLD